MIRRPPRATRTDTLLPYTTLFRSTGTLVADALTPGRRLFMLSTGTGLAPFLSLARDPDIYERFNQIVIVHCVRRVSDLAFREELESQLAGDPLVQDQDRKSTRLNSSH